MSQRLDGVREANRCHGFALTPFILQKSRMRKRARTDLCGGRSVRIVPTATAIPKSGRDWRSVSELAIERQCRITNSRPEN